MKSSLINGKQGSNFPSDSLDCCAGVSRGPATPDRCGSSPWCVYLVHTRPTSLLSRITRGHQSEARASESLPDRPADRPRRDRKPRVAMQIQFVGSCASHNGRFFPRSRSAECLWRVGVLDEPFTHAPLNSLLEHFSARSVRPAHLTVPW